MYFLKVLFLFNLIICCLCGVTKKANQYKNSHSNNEKVKVEVYYETLCPGCQDFIAYRLRAAINSLADYMDIQMYPYGNAETINVDGQFEFNCQHGQAECYGNMLHGCAIELLKNNTLSALLNACMIEGKSDDNSLKSCVKQFRVDADAIMKCAKSDTGKQILAKYGQITKSTGADYVPYIKLNGADDDETNKNVYIKREICKLLKNPPKQC